MRRKARRNLFAGTAPAAKQTAMPFGTAAARRSAEEIPEAISHQVKEYEHSDPDD